MTNTERARSRKVLPLPWERAGERVHLKELDEVLASGYGIFSGKNVQWATLKFTGAAAKYVSMEEWQSKQKARWEKDGSYVLEVPFSSEKELMMDIHKHGADVEVVAPESLRSSIRQSLKTAERAYG